MHDPPPSSLPTPKDQIRDLKMDQSDPPAQLANFIDSKSTLNDEFEVKENIDEKQDQVKEHFSVIDQMKDHNDIKVQALIQSGELENGSGLHGSNSQLPPLLSSPSPLQFQLETQKSLSSSSSPSKAARLSTSFEALKQPYVLIQPSDSFVLNPRGLHNLGNTCYMNAALQCLVHAVDQGFIKHLLQLRQSNVFFDGKHRVTKAFAEACSEMMKTSPGGNGHLSPFAPWQLRSALATLDDRFGGYEQQDSQELVLVLLDAMFEEFKVGSKGGDGDKENDSSNNPIRETFYGTLESRVTCGSCQKDSITKEPFLTLSLPLIKPKTDQIDNKSTVDKKNSQQLINEASNQNQWVLVFKAKGKKFFSWARLRDLNEQSSDDPHRMFVLWQREENEEDMIQSEQSSLIYYEKLPGLYVNGKALAQDWQFFWFAIEEGKDLKGTLFNHVINRFPILLPCEGTLNFLEFRLRQFLAPSLSSNNYSENDDSENDDIDPTLINDEDLPDLSWIHRLRCIQSDNSPSCSSNDREKNLIVFGAEMFTCTSGSTEEEPIDIDSLRSFLDDEVFQIPPLPITHKMDSYSVHNSSHTGTQSNQHSFTLSLVDDCLKAFCAPEPITNFDCPSCKRRIPNSKRVMRILELPKTLIIHLKRFHYINHGIGSGGIGNFVMGLFGSGSGGRKINTLVKCPLNLELSDIASAVQEQKIDSNASRRKKYLKQRPIDDSTLQPYSLRGVVEHAGGLSSGHYTSKINLQSIQSINSNWFSCNDSHVSRTRHDPIEENAFGMEAPTGIADERAYLLFYTR